MAAGRLFAGNHVRQSVTAVVAGLAHVQDCVHAFDGKKHLHINDAADIQDDDGRRIGGGNLPEAYNLLIEKLILPGQDVAVFAFAGVPGNDTKGGVRFAGPEILILHRKDCRVYQRNRNRGNCLSR